MAYMDDMAIEREKSRQALLAGKTPLMGADSSAALHALGVKLGVVPPGTPPSAVTQVLADLMKGPGRVKVDESRPLQVQPLAGRTTSVPGPAFSQDDSVGNTITASLGTAKDSALQQMLRDQQRAQQQEQQSRQQQQQPGTPAPPTNPNLRAMANRGRAPRSPEGATYKDDLKYLNDRGGHASVVKDGKIVSVPVDTPGAYGQVDPELAARLRAAGEAYEKENPGKKAQFGEFSRGEDVQKIYHDRYKAGGGIAARPGHSGHQRGVSGDLPDSHFRKWLYAGNQDKYGVHFPVKGDAPHVEVNPRFKGPSFSNPPGAAPAAGAPAAGGNATLAQQRAQFRAQAQANPALRDSLAATMLTESSTPEGQQGVAEAAMNRVASKGGKDLTAGLDPNYHADVQIANNGAKYKAALAKIQSDPALKAQLYALQDKAFDGSNITNLATDYSSKGVAERAAKNSTPTFASPDGQSFFRKDIDPVTHGAGNVAKTQAWHKQTTAAMAAPAAPAKPTASAQATPQAPAQAAPQAEAKPAAAAAPPEAPAFVPPDGPPEAPPFDPQASPQAPAPAEPAAPVPAAAAPVPPPTAPAAPTRPPPAAAAAAPVAPPAAAPPQPAAKPAPPVNPAHAVLDTKVIDLVKRGGTPEQIAQVPGFIANKTLREALQMPMIGGQVANGVKPYLGKMGVTQQQFDQAVKEGPPKPTTLGKRSEAPVVPEAQQKVRYAEARSGVVSDAGPDTPDKPAGFDPEGPDYDMESAVAAGLKPDETGHWPSRDPASGKLLKGRGHETWAKTVEGEAAAGMEIYEKDGRYYSRPAAEATKAAGPNQEAPPAAPAEAGPARAAPGAAPAAEQVKAGPQPGTVTPEYANALRNAFADQEARAPQVPVAPDSLPVLPIQPSGPAMQHGPEGGAGSLSLAPQGLQGGALGGAPGSQGGSIATAGMLPAIQNATFSTPLIDQTAASGSTIGQGNLSPIPWQTLGNWGWGGGGNIGAGFDWGGGGGGGGGFSMPMIGYE